MGNSRKTGGLSTAVRRSQALLVLLILQPALAGAADAKSPTQNPNQAAPAIIRHIFLAQGEDDAELQIITSGQAIPQARVLSNPERAVLDFPNVLPGSDLRQITGNRGGIKTVRMSVLPGQPPVTRIVVDLTSPRSCRLESSGSGLLFAVGARGPRTELTFAKPSTLAPGQGAAEAKTADPPKPLIVAARAVYRNGLLTINAPNSTLAEVLSAVRAATGSDIEVPPAGTGEHVAVRLGPASPRQVMTTLLQGTQFNFIILGSERDPEALQRIILSPRSDTTVRHPALAAIPPASEARTEPAPEPAPASGESDVPTDLADSNAAATAAVPAGVPGRHRRARPDMAPSDGEWIAPLSEADDDKELPSEVDADPQASAPPNPEN